MVEKATSFLGENDHRGNGDEYEDLYTFLVGQEMELKLTISKFSILPRLILLIG
jgi:hypothetical protein